LALLCHSKRRQPPPPPQKKQVNPYTVLGVSKDATPVQIKRAYRAKSMKYHPDKNKSPNAKEMMTKVNEAFEMISDPDAKTIYDEFGDSEKYHDRWSYMQSRRGRELAKKDFYMHSDDVKTMEMKTFYQNVRKSPYLVEFYAPWCVHCQEMVPKFKKAAVLLEDIVTLGAVNCEKHNALCQQQGIQSYPTVKFFHPVERGEAQEVEKFQGGHNPEEIYSWIQQSLSNEVVKLDASNFRELVTESDDLWLIDFSAGAWCGPCSTLKPHIRRLAGNLKGIVKTGIVECDANNEFCHSKSVSFYPQMKLFKKGGPEDGESISDQEQHFNPALSVLNLFEKVVKLVYVPPPAPTVEDSSAEDTQRELDDDEIIDDVGDDDEVPVEDKKEL